MLNRTLCILAILGAVLIATCNGTELNTNESEAKSFLTQSSAKLFRIYEEATDGKFSPIYNVQIQTVMNEAAALKKIDREARKFDFENFKDKDLKFSFEVLLRGIDLKTLKRRRFSELFDASEELSRLLQNENIDDFYDSNIARTYSPDIENIIKTSQDPEELQYYWNNWRNSTEKWADNNFDLICKALKEAAKINKVSPLDFWLRGYNITDMEDLMAELKPLYLELHAFIRNLLRQKYGESLFPADGLIPIHLFEQVLLQISTNQSIIEDMFPFDGLPPFEVVMEKLKDQQLVKITEGFYKNLGFEEFPSSIWGDRLKLQIFDEDDEDHEDEDKKGNEDENDEKPVDEDNECYNVYGFLTPNIRLEFCENLTYEDLLDIYAIMGYLHYSKEMQMAGLPGYFFKPPQDLEQPIGEALLLSASTHQNLKEIGLIQNFNITQDVEINRLLRMAIFRVINIPLDFVYTKVMADLLAENIETSELGRYYWELMEKYVGVGPPKGHENSEFDLPYSFYEKMSSNEMSIDLTTSFSTYQIYKKLCELSGKYRKEELHLCNINGSKKAGNVLKTMMQLGSSKPYNQVLATMFPDNQNLKAEALLEYYNPIKKLLVEKNKEAKVSTGWKNSNPKKS